MKYSKFFTYTKCLPGYAADLPKYMAVNGDGRVPKGKSLEERDAVERPERPEDDPRRTRRIRKSRCG
jgi:hypothetical protein